MKIKPLTRKQLTDRIYMLEGLLEYHELRNARDKMTTQIESLHRSLTLEKMRADEFEKGEEQARDQLGVLMLENERLKNGKVPNNPCAAKSPANAPWWKFWKRT
jgi:hypothetical protein